MSIRALQEYTYYSKYARYNSGKNRRETWNEAVDRVMDMHLRRYPKAAEEIEWVRPLMKEKRVLGSQRALQFGGKTVEKCNARQYNCTMSFCDRIRFFQEYFWLLLCGCGVGFSVQKHHIAKLPPFDIPKGRKKKKKFVIPDSIEGWADAVGVLLASFLPNPDFPEYACSNVEFDYSEIRLEGSSLSSCSGKAPGPEPLRRSLEIIRSLLQNRTQTQSRLHSIDAYDIAMHASDAVLSGGVRRSASLCIFSLDDEEMIKAKTGNWFRENPQRGRSNNSTMLIRDKVTKAEFLSLIDSVKQFGEPGFYWSDSTEQLPNPCVEIGGWPVHWKTKESGWQACNLSEINGKKVKCREDFALAARAAAILGTLQAGYTNLSYLGPVTEEIVKKESLLGVSVTGMQDNPHVTFDPKLQREMAQLVIDTNSWLAQLIGINPAARCTCIKPSGTASCILGSASGVHPHHARRYARRVQANQLEEVFQHFKKYNPQACEKSVWSANDTDEIVTFCVEVPDGAKTKNDVSAIELLEDVKTTQQNWVTAGKRKELCTQEWLTHNVSNTINVRPDEWGDVADFIYKNRKWFAGVSLLPASGDLDYPQAPMTNIHTPREILSMYGDGALLASGLVVDGLAAFQNNLWAACDAALGLNGHLMHGETDSDQERKEDWCRRVEQFAGRYCDGDVRKATYLIKEVNNWKKWLDLRRSYVDVDYTELVETEDNTKPLEEVACAGGSCELI